MDMEKLHVLMALWENPDNTKKVSAIARNMGVQSYQVSRIMSALEQEGLVDKSIERHPVLTDAGCAFAKDFQRKRDILITHLIYEGVEEEQAKRDAWYWAESVSDETMEVLEAANEHYRIKYELREEKSFSGNILCKLMRDGDYPISFIFYKIDGKARGELSMANNGFENPCILQVRDGKGTIRLKTKRISAESGSDGHTMAGKIDQVKYYDHHRYVEAKQQGDLISFPANAIRFMNCGTGMTQFLCGTINLKMHCSVGRIHMPESETLFSITI